MEIARLTAICRKSDCGPLGNELVRLRAQIANLEERETGDSESQSQAEEEMDFASQAEAEGELVHAKHAELEEEETKNSDLDSKNVDLQSNNDDLEIEVLKPESDLARCRIASSANVMQYKELGDITKQP
jgi:hypothetical protein